MPGRRRQLLLGMLLIAPAVGCYTVDFFQPGTARRQQFNASLHDPYPDDDLGPPVVGGRPRDFQQPLAEPVRNRWLRDGWWSR